MKIRTLLILLVLAAAAGCEGQRTIAGPTQPPSGGNVPAATIAVPVEGRVIDADRDELVPGAVVTAAQVCAPGACRALSELPAPRATTDNQGVFFLTANLPTTWRELLLSVARDGYEPTRVYFSPTGVTAAVLRLHRTLSIRAGESIETTVFFGVQVCGFESWICRRIVVESAPGESMDLEVIPADGQEVGLIVGKESTHPISPSPQRRVTMSSGEVWLYGSVGRVTVTAHRR